MTDLKEKILDILCEGETGNKPDYSRFMREIKSGTADKIVSLISQAVTKEREEIKEWAGINTTWEEIKTMSGAELGRLVISQTSLWNYLESKTENKKYEI